MRVFLLTMILILQLQIFYLASEIGNVYDQLIRQSDTIMILNQIIGERSESSNTSLPSTR